MVDNTSIPYVNAIFLEDPAGVTDEDNGSGSWDRTEWDRALGPSGKLDVRTLEFNEPDMLKDFSQFPFMSSQVVSVIVVRDPLARMQSDFTLLPISSRCVVMANQCTTYS
jgi:hypothetical protein